MNYLLTALSRYFLLPALFASFVFSNKAFAQTCNNWLGTPSAGSFVTIGDLDITGNKLTVEAVFNRVSALGNGFNFGKLVSKHTDQTNVNYSLMPLQCEITTDVTGYVATPQVCLPTLDKTYHVAMVYDGATLKFYRDGYLLTETPCTGNLVNNNLLTTIGQLAGPAHPLNMQHLGYINEVRIWNTARTQAELRAYMHIALPAPVQTGLVGYYSFNNLLNKQGNVAFNGTLNGPAQINQTNTNCAFAPDSCGVVLSPSCSNWLNTPSQPSWVNVGDLDVPGNQLTVEALINIKGIPPGGVIQGLDVVSKHTGPTNVNYLLRSSHAELSTTNGYFFTPDGCDLEMNKTYHVAMVYNGVSLKYYRNGFLLGETPATGNMIQNNLPTGIGFISTLLQAENFIGFINEVRIWNVARSQAQIRANMNISLVNPPAQAGLLAYYTFDNLLNKQGNPAWNGTLVGAASINRTNPECVFVADTCAIPSPCDQSLSIPTQGSKLTVGDVDVTGNQLTVEAMFNRSAPLNNGIYYGHLVSKHTDQFNANYALLPNGCEITTSVSGYTAIFQTCVPELGKTYHVAMVYDGATLKFYRNGFLMSQVACTGNIVNNNLATTIGQIASGADPFNNQFLGYTNEVRIWNVARTQGQIATYMNQSLPNPTTQTGLRAYYSFNDLRNKQGNAAFNGTLHGNAVVGSPNPDCAFVPSSCNTVPDVIASFTAPDTVCVNTAVNLTNISLNATSQYWSFCAADANKIPTAVNLGNPGGSLSLPVFSDVVNDNGNYHVFVSNNWPGGLVRMDFGNSLLNAPVVVNLGNIGGVIPNTIEGIQVVKNEGRWYAIMVGGDFATGGIPSRIIKIDIGVNITNPVPVGTNWGNIGNLAYPVDLNLFQENGNWYGFTVNAQNNTITRFNFSNSFTNVPTGVNLGNLGGLNYPTGINAVKDNGNWYVFITNDVVNSFLVRLNFGNSLLNVPTAVNLGNPGNVLHKTRDIYIMKACDQITGLAVNGDGYNDLVKLDFNNNITGTPTGVSLGNTGNMNFPHSISRLFRAGNDLYSFVTNVTNNTLTRIRFEGCTNSSIPNSALQTPPPITYSTPGVYNINLTVDEGLPTQTSFCKQVVVKDCTIPIVPDFDIPDTVCVNTPVNITNNTIGATSHYWNFCTGDINKAPTGTNLGNVGGLLSQPVFMDYAFYNGNYYGFSINHYPGKLVRLNFGNSLLNTPTATDLGNFGGIIPPGYGAEGIQIVQNEGKWYAIIVGGYTPSGSTPRVLKIDFGANLSNAAPVATDWGNIGNLYQPIDLHVFKENNNWYGLTINAENNTITRFSFTNSFDNVPTAVNLGGFGMLDYPTGIYAINDNGFWRVFVTNNGSNSRLVRLDFGNSLLNVPTAVNLGGIGNSNGLRDLTILKYCDQVVGFAVNGTTNSLYRLNFATLTSVPTVTNLGNIGNLNTPHSISRLFRVNDDLYGFITNVGNNTITRLQFEGCTNSNPANSALQNPPPVIYNVPGTYNINLTIDDGLPTQSSICKQVVVKNCDIVVDPPDTTGCGGFQLAIGGQAYDRAFDVAATTNNEFYVAGISRSFTSSDDILVTRLTAAGATIWSKTFGNTGQEIVRKITSTADGGLLIVGQTKSFANNQGDILCMKIAANGNLLWSKVLGLGSANGDLGMDIIETTDGGYAVSGIINVNGTVADAVVTKLNNIGNVVWSKRFDRGDGENGVGILQKQDTLIIGIDLQNTTVNYELVLMKLRLADGAFIMSKKITPDTRGLFNSYVLKDPLQPGYIVSAHTIENSSYADMKHTVIRVDEEFNVRKSQLFSFNPATNDFYTGLAVLPDGSVIGTASSQTNTDGYIYRINEDNSGVFVKKFYSPLYRVAVSGQQLMAVGGVTSNGQEDFFVTSFDINGVLGSACNTEDISLILQQSGYNVSSFTWPNISDVNFPVTAAVLNTATPPVFLKELCPSQNRTLLLSEIPVRLRLYSSLPILPILRTMNGILEMDTKVRVIPIR